MEKFINVAKKISLLKKKPVFFIEKNNLELILQGYLESANSD